MQRSLTKCEHTECRTDHSQVCLILATRSYFWYLKINQDKPLYQQSKEEKNHKIIPVSTEKAFDKIQYLRLVYRDETSQ